MNDTDRLPLIGLTLDDLKGVAAEAGLPGFAAGQMAKWLYEKRVESIDEMTNLSKAAREKLARRYCVGRVEPRAAACSVDGTIKYLFPATDAEIGGRKSNLDVEAVYIPDKDRATLCVSSQAGCKMACQFCMTGRQGFHGSLSARDIINQVLSIKNPESLTNIVFMGMGEPLDNLPAVAKAIDILTAKWGMAWSPKRITVSTIGKTRELKELIEKTKVHIALSVHNPIPRLRAEIMPVEKAYPIREVMDLLRDYDFAHQRRLSVEYIMWDGVNDSPSMADALAKLIKGTSARVNLIRYHAIPGYDLKPATQAAMEQFRDRLNDQGVTATIRASRGEDIMAACGMLAGKAKSKS